MKVIFLYTQQNTVFFKKPLTGQEEMNFGISYISALLEQQGHTTELLVLNRKNDGKNKVLIQKVIQDAQPVLLCFTAVFSEYDYICQLGAFIKNKIPGLFLLLGGVHITLNPSEEALQIFDALCIGEGEFPVCELVEKLAHQKPVTGIQNLWIRSHEGIEKNETRPFLSDLDVLPFPNRKMWQPWILNQETRLTVLLGRGCPFNCTYCSNHRLRKVAQGKYVRLRSPQNIIQELEYLTSLFPDTLHYFLEVETLGTDLFWLEDLCNHLHAFNTDRTSPLSFSANLRIYPELKTELVFKWLKHANFESVIIGLESGSEQIRKKVLSRNYKNEDILKAAAIARSYDIRIGLFNLVGLPEETPEKFSETLSMNQKIQPDWHATSIFYPYPGTDLYDRVKSMRVHFKEAENKDERQKARIDYPEFSKKEIQSAFDSFHLNVYKYHTAPKLWKTGIYFLQSAMGHHRMANLKRTFIKVLYFLRLEKLAKKWGLFGIFQ